MKNRFIKAGIVMLILALTAFALVSCSSDSNSDNNGSSGDTGNVDTFVNNLKSDNFTVQEGEFSLVDAIDLFDRGIIINCNGNNAGNPYFSYKLPPAPGQTLPNIIENLVYPLRADEALVFVGKTPPEMKYFSYRSFMVNRYFDDAGSYKKIYASMGDNINYLTINTEGTEGAPYNQRAIIITTSDRGIDARVKNAAKTAGYPETIMNTDVIPSALVNMGLSPGADYFSFLARTAEFIDEEACQEYQKNPGVRVFRITPNTQTALDPFPTPELRRRGTGTNEMDLMPSVEDLRKAILAKYSDYDAAEYQTQQWLPEAYESIQGDTDVLGESRDTSYLRTDVATEFTLSDDPNDFLIVYGVNHQATGKCIYSNFVTYGAKYFNGVASVNNDTFAGSAANYIPGNENEKYLYAWKVARNANGDLYCLEVPTGPQSYGIPLTDSIFIGFRSYVETATKVGPAYNEIIFDRVIHFTGKKNGKVFVKKNAPFHSLPLRWRKKVNLV